MMKNQGHTRFFQALFFCAILTFHLSTYAQSAKTLKFRHLTIENGLLSNNVRSLLQDKYGFIWIGTEYGIERYDGHEFVRPRGTMPKANTPALCETGDTIWIGYNGGVAYYSHRCDSIAHFDIQTKEGVSINSNITRIMADKEGNIWFATMSQGIFKLLRNGEMKQYSMPGDEMVVSTLLVTGNGDVWASSNWSEYNFVKLNKKTDKFEPLKYTCPDGLDFRIGNIALAEGDNGIVWIGTWSNGLIRYDSKNNTATTALKSDGEHLYHIHWIEKAGDGTLYISSDQGLCAYNPKTLETNYYKQDELSSHALIDRYTYPILIDREGAIWVGTYFSGLEYANPKASNFTSYIESSYRNSVSGNIISKFCEDSNGTLWIGSDDGGLSSFDKKTGTFRSYESQGSMNKRNIHGMCVIGDELFLGTYSSGFYIINTKTGAEKHFPDLKGTDGKSYGVSAYSIYKDSRGIIWIGTFHNVLIYDPETGLVTPKLDTNTLVIDIIEDKNGDLWCCGDEDGIYRFIRTKGTWKKYDSFKSGDKNSGERLIANSVYIDKNGTLWSGTSAGLFCYNSKKDTFESIGLRGQYPDIRSISGEGDKLWMASPAGLIVFSTKTNQVIRVYKSGEGMDNINFIQSAIFKSKDGTIYAGTSHGFTSFVPSNIKSNVGRLKVIFTGIELFGKPVPVGGDNIKDNLNTIDKVEFSYKQTSLRISFSAMSYLMPENNTYQYYLEGYEDTWNIPTHEHSATYTNLSPGEYILHVRTANIDGEWDDEDTTLTIVITPPFYWNTPTKCLYILLLFIALYYVVRHFIKKMEKQHIAEINEITEQKEHEVHEARIKYLTISDSDNQFLKKLENTIEKNFSNPEISVEFLANEMGVSRSGLFAKVKALADVTPNEMIQIIRLKHAAHLLETKQYRVNEICYMVGFNSPSYFTKCFVKHYGVKPAEYNKQSNAETEKEQE